MQQLTRVAAWVQFQCAIPLPVSKSEYRCEDPDDPHRELLAALANPHVEILPGGQLKLVFGIRPADEGMCKVGGTGASYRTG